MESLDLSVEVDDPAIPWPDSKQQLAAVLTRSSSVEIEDGPHISLGRGSDHSRIAVELEAIVWHPQYGIFCLGDESVTLI
jgi:hypothetical protein